jgi:hypothetical protein
LVTGARIQQWEVIAFDSDSVTLAERGPNNAKFSAASSQRKHHVKPPLKLYVAARGHSIAPFRITAGSDINTQQRQAAADLPNLPAVPAKN